MCLGFTSSSSALLSGAALGFPSYESSMVDCLMKLEITTGIRVDNHGNRPPALYRLRKKIHTEGPYGLFRN